MMDKIMSFDERADLHNEVLQCRVHGQLLWYDQWWSMKPGHIREEDAMSRSITLRRRGQSPYLYDEPCIG